MAEKQEIQFEISSEGEVSYEMKGFIGNSCLDISKVVDEALGKVVKSGNSGDMYKQRIVKQQNVYG